MHAAVYKKTGWMATEILALWFQNYTEQVEERSLLVIYDGYLTHVSLELIKKAIKEKSQ